MTSSSGPEHAHPTRLPGRMRRGTPAVHRRLPSALLALLLLALPALADVLHMKDGRRIEGTIEKETQAEVSIETRFGLLTFARSEIREIVRGKSPRQQFDERWEAAESAAEFFDLGTWADERKLRGPARKAMKRAVKLDPGHAAANTWLGRVEHRGEWMEPEERERRIAAEEVEQMRKRGLVSHEGRWVTLAEKEKLDAGLVYHEGRWLSEEQLQRARGLVLHAGEWTPEYRVRALLHARKVLEELGGLEATILTGNTVALGGPFPQSFLDPILTDLENGRRWFDQLMGAEPGLALIGGRLAEFYVYGRNSAPYVASVDHLASLTSTVPAGWAGAVKKVHGFVYWDPFCVSSARALGRPLEDLAGHCYHHWGHLLVNRLGYDGRLVPPWLDEGFASLFEFTIHRRNAVFCVTSGSFSSAGATAVTKLEYAFDSKTFRRGSWRQVLRAALEAGDRRIATFDKLAQKQIGELNLVDIATSMAIVDWLAQREGALRRFHDALRVSAPLAPQRVILKGAERQARYDAAFGAALDTGWREADQAWRTWFLTEVSEKSPKRERSKGGR